VVGTQKQEGVEKKIKKVRVRGQKRARATDGGERLRRLGKDSLSSRGTEVRNRPSVTERKMTRRPGKGVESYKRGLQSREKSSSGDAARKKELSCDESKRD